MGLRSFLPSNTLPYSCERLNIGFGLGTKRTLRNCLLDRAPGSSFRNSEGWTGYVRALGLHSCACKLVTGNALNSPSLPIATFFATLLCSFFHQEVESSPYPWYLDWLFDWLRPTEGRRTYSITVSSLDLPKRPCMFHSVFWNLGPVMWKKPWPSTGGPIASTSFGQPITRQVSEASLGPPDPNQPNSWRLMCGWLALVLLRWIQISAPSPNRLMNSYQQSLHLC